MTHVRKHRTSAPATMAPSATQDRHQAASRPDRCPCHGGRVSHATFLRWVQASCACAEEEGTLCAVNFGYRDLGIEWVNLKLTELNDCPVCRGSPSPATCVSPHHGDTHLPTRPSCIPKTCRVISTRMTWQAHLNPRQVPGPRNLGPLVGHSAAIALYPRRCVLGVTQWAGLADLVLDRVVSRPTQWLPRAR